jgi:hypothetical protein
VEAVATLAHMFEVLVEDATALVRSEVYKRALVDCLSNPYDEDRLARFLALDNIICKDICLLVGVKDTAVLWEAREQAFGEAWDAVVADTLPGLLRASTDLNDRRRLRHVLFNALSVRIPEDVFEQIEIGLK